MKWSDLKLRLRALVSRRRVDEELDEELTFHIEMQKQKHLAGGMDENAAKRRARMEFGARDAVAEECRDQRRVSFVETLLQDIRYALRGLRRTPVFALTVIATIALGLGWNTAAFTLFNAYVLHPISVRDPYSLFGLRWEDTAGRGRAFTWQQAQELQTDLPAFSEIAVIDRQQARMNSRQAFGLLVTGNYFSMLGVRAQIGRTIAPEDASTPGSAPVIVLSYPAWQTRFGGSPDVLGKSVSVDGHSLEVIGVMQESFTGFEGTPLDYWAPITMAGTLDGVDVFGVAQTARFDLFGRLKHGLDEGQALAFLTPRMQRLTADQAAKDRARRAWLYSEATRFPLNARILVALSPILAAFLLVLLSACANVANMMLARAMSRQREIGIRLSLGASRRRLIRQLLTESLLLSVPAAAAGFWISEVIVGTGVRIILATVPQEFAEYVRVVPLPPDWRVFAFMIFAAVISALLFGLAPALQATRLNIMQAARGDFSNEFRPGRLRNALVVAQVTVCAVLLICTGVLLRGAHHVDGQDLGMNTRPVIEIDIQEKSRQRVLETLAAEPSVDLVAASSDPPLNFMPTATVLIGNSPTLQKTQYSYVSPQFLSVLDIPIVKGRNFSAEEDSSSAPVALVSETAARRFWPNQDLLGQSIQLSNDRVPHPFSVRVIGIARDIVTGPSYRDDPDRTCIYLPTSVDAAGNVVLVRVKGDTEAARQRLDLVLERGDPGAVLQIQKMQEFVALHVYPYHAAYWVSASIGVLALLLALSGIYGVLSYVVAQRTKEIGIRMAMGARRLTLVCMFLRQSLRLAVMGALAGALIAFGTLRILAFAIPAINSNDLVPFEGGVLLILAACVCAAFFPALRAAGVNPTVTLRCD